MSKLVLEMVEVLEALDRVGGCTTASGIKKLTGGDADIPAVMRSCQNEGMQDFAESLRVLVDDEWIDYSVGMQYAPNKEELKMALKGIRTSSGGIL